MFYLAWTNLRYRLLRTLVAALSITVGIWLAMTLRGVSEGTLAKSLDDIRGFERYMMIRMPGPVVRLPQSVIKATPEQLKELEAVEGLASMLPFRFFLQQLTADRFGMVVAFPVDSMKYAADLFPVVQGTSIDGSAQALMEHKLAKVLGVEIGQTLTLTGLGTFTVRGMFESKTQMATAQLLLDFGTVAKSLNDSRIQGIFIKAESLESVPRVQKKVQEMFPDLLVEPMKLLADSLEVTLVRFDQLINLIFWLSITVAGLISGLVLLSMVGEQRRDIGILKAMGASDRAVLILILSQATLLALSGAALGALLAWLVKAAFLPRFWPALDMELTVRWLFEALSAGLVAGWAGALAATGYALRVDPVEVLIYE